MRGIQCTRTFTRSLFRQCESQTRTNKRVAGNRVLESKRTFQSVSRLSCENQVTRAAMVLSVSNLRYALTLPEDSLARAWIDGVMEEDDDGT
mmetsp:Transcript_12898/g.15128  ORF Transcript_12898/g.15128 Transcript_12898/m.15128 type:complete len:92 (-) Transcript_12898:320-595(-)